MSSVVLSTRRSVMILQLSKAGSRSMSCIHLNYFRGQLNS